MKISVNAVPFVRALNACIVAASDDVTRENLNAVRFGIEMDCETASAPAFDMVATDGHWLARWTFETSDVVGSTPGGATHALIRKDDALHIAKMLGKNPIATVDVDLDARTVSFLGTSVTFAACDANFPNYKQVTPALRAIDGLCAIGIGAELLARVCKGFSAGAGRAKRHNSIGLAFEFAGGPLDPIVVRCDGAPHLSAVVMPMRMNFAQRANMAETYAQHAAE